MSKNLTFVVNAFKNNGNSLKLIEQRIGALISSLGGPIGTEACGSTQANLKSPGVEFNGDIKNIVAELKSQLTTVNEIGFRIRRISSNTGEINVCPSAEECSKKPISEMFHSGPGVDLDIDDIAFNLTGINKAYEDAIFYSLSLHSTALERIAVFLRGQRPTAGAETAPHPKPDGIIDQMAETAEDIAVVIAHMDGIICDLEQVLDITEHDDSAPAKAKGIPTPPASRPVAPVASETSKPDYPHAKF